MIVCMGYRWKIDRDYIEDGAARGVEGPGGLDASIDLSTGVRFRMLDGDGEVYYGGVIAGDYCGFEPLDDYGMPNAGATSIEYRDDAGQWKEL
jgi:hypothetical protein